MAAISAASPTVIARCTRSRVPRHTREVGYNPHRPFRARPVDYAMVVAAIVLAIVLVAWAVFG